MEFVAVAKVQIRNALAVDATHKSIDPMNSFELMEFLATYSIPIGSSINSIQTDDLLQSESVYIR